MDKKGVYAIRYVSQRTGLTPHVIRAWEKRYKAVVPLRSPKNRRLYSEDDVQRLLLLKRVTDEGHNISHIAKLDSSELLELAQQEASMAPWATNSNSRHLQQKAAQDYRNECLSAVINLDPDRLNRSYDQATVDLTRSALLKEVIVPLFEEIGNLWRNGSLKIINEHMATSVTRTLLLNMLRATAVSDTAPRIVIATAVGQWHDMGALTVALTAAEYGWHPLYYGPNLPVEEIAAAVKQSSARAVAISITHLLDQHPLVSELRKLRRYIGNDLILFVGGQAVSGHPQIIEEINAKHIPNIDQLSEELNSAFNGNVD
ncbi:MAG: MerR family transcriptional regulator [Desulfobacterales bacterium]|jgi:DNA-binding transcriptional MerR regulator/methylmalonyl-CoA mutase cobalamin-binding subunit